jgi:hypothetical protein
MRAEQMGGGGKSVRFVVVSIALLVVLIATTLVVMVLTTVLVVVVVGVLALLAVAVAIVVLGALGMSGHLGRRLKRDVEPQTMGIRKV